MEIKVLARLEELGISESMVMEHRDKGGRSAIIGTYRILMYRASCEEAEAASAASVETSTEDNQEKNENNLAPPTISLAGSMSRSIKSHRSDSSKLDASSSSNRLAATPPSSLKQQAQLTQESPAKTKLKHKFNFTILPNKKSNFPSEKKTAKKKKGSQACTIL